MSERRSEDSEIRRQGDQSQSRRPSQDIVRAQYDDNNNNGDGGSRGPETRESTSGMRDWFRRRLGRGRREENASSAEEFNWASYTPTEMQNLRQTVINRASNIVARNQTIRKNAESYGNTYEGLTVLSNDTVFQHTTQSEAFRNANRDLKATISDLKRINDNFEQFNKGLSKSKVYYALKPYPLLDEGETLDPTGLYSTNTSDQLIFFNRQQINENKSLISKNESRISNAENRMTREQREELLAQPPLYELPRSPDAAQPPEPQSPWAPDASSQQQDILPPPGYPGYSTGS